MNTLTNKELEFIIIHDKNALKRVKALQIRWQHEPPSKKRTQMLTKISLVLAIRQALFSVL